MTYLFKPKRNLVFTTESVRVRYPEIRRQIGTSLGGVFVRTEGTGQHDHKKLFIRPGKLLSGKGLNAGNYVTQVSATAASLKTALRRMRPEEEAKIRAKDAEIEDLQAAIGRLRIEREALVAEAWAKAHVVRLNELDIKNEKG